MVLAQGIGLKKMKKVWCTTGIEKARDEIWYIGRRGEKCALRNENDICLAKTILFWDSSCCSYGFVFGGFSLVVASIIICFLMKNGLNIYSLKKLCTPMHLEFRPRI